MPSYSGKFQYFDAGGVAQPSGPCELTFDSETFTLAPAAGAPLAFDLGDVDVFAPGDYELSLTLYTGKRILLHQFGRAFQNLARELLEAYRERLMQCLLLEDLEEVARFDGFLRLESPAQTLSSPAEIRLHRSNLAVLPTAAMGFQWRLADVDSVRFDRDTYAVKLESSGERLEVTKLAKRTEEFRERLEESVARLNEKSARALRSVFPFLAPDQLQQTAQLMREGQAAPLAKLAAIHPKIKAALISGAVDPRLRPYWDVLLGRMPPGWLYTGFKFIRREEETAEGPDDQAEVPAEEQASESVSQEPAESPVAGTRGSEAAEMREKEEPILFWFFFPVAAKAGAELPANVVAWEATSKSGRATYFFRLVGPEQAGQLGDAAKAPEAVEAAVRRLARAIALLSSRREPIYLPEESLELQPRYRRYAIACRKMVELRWLRANFLGRAIHTSLPAWQKQVDEILARAGR